MSALAIACSRCGAEAGHACTGSRGKVRHSLHYARIEDFREAQHALARQLDYDRAIEWERKAQIEANDLIERLSVIAVSGPGFLCGDHLHAMLDDAIARRLPEPTYTRRPGKAVIAGALRKAVYERDAYRCVTCGTHLDLSCDHILAESKGGPTTLDNLQTMCRSCNSRKGAR